MKLKAVIIADDVAENIGELCVMLKNSTNQMLEQFQQANRVCHAGQLPRDA